MCTWAGVLNMYRVKWQFSINKLWVIHLVVQCMFSVAPDRLFSCLKCVFKDCVWKNYPACRFSFCGGTERYWHSVGILPIPLPPKKWTAFLCCWSSQNGVVYILERTLPVTNVVPWLILLWLSGVESLKDLQVGSMCTCVILAHRSDLGGVKMLGDEPVDVRNTK